jgi:hypothetical protein
MPERDVADKQHAIQKRPKQSQGIAGPFHVDQDKHADRRQGERRDVAAGPQAIERNADRADELDRRDQADR